jgi:hypothetical protein
LAFNDLVKTYDFDATRAKPYLTKISKILAAKNRAQTMLQYLDIAEKIASDWRETLGIQVEVKVVSNVTSDYQVLLTDFSPPSILTNTLFGTPPKLPTLPTLAISRSTNCWRTGAALPTKNCAPTSTRISSVSSSKIARQYSSLNPLPTLSPANHFSKIDQNIS